jgi:transcriptional regulator with XRE-family HTH domain
MGAMPRAELASTEMPDMGHGGTEHSDAGRDETGHDETGHDEALYDCAGVTADDDDSFAIKLQRLFRDIRPKLDLTKGPANEDGTGTAADDDAAESTRKDARYTRKEVAMAVGITPAYLGYLYHGKRKGPRTAIVHKLERFFGVDHGYLCPGRPDVVARVDQQLDVLKKLRDNGVLGMAQRASKIQTSAGRAVVEDMVDHVLRLEAQAPAVAEPHTPTQGPRAVGARA